MNDFPRWKYALVALAMLFGIVYALPNAFVPLPAVQVTASQEGTPPVDDAVAKMTELRNRISTDLVHATVVKIVGDGTQGGYTAWLVEPSSKPAKPPRPRDPTTSRSTAVENSVMSAEAFPSMAWQ